MRRFWLSFQRLTGLIKRDGHACLSLAEFAMGYQPTLDHPDLLRCWEALQRLVRSVPSHRDELLGGLMHLLAENGAQDNVRVCLNAGCEMAVALQDDQLCIEPHDDLPACCRLDYMQDALREMASAYDRACQEAG
ncbi:MAG: hypothetical protein Kow00124_06290 [Anaerolineae bacterium]